MDLPEQFFKFLKTHLPPSQQGRGTLLAVSGGLDSVVLAQLFHAAGLPFAIAHCNFQLRGIESDEDALFVENLAKRYEVRFFLKHFETREFAAENGLSTQMAARALRYSWFAELAENEGFDQLATAHHLNDAVETALLNFVRGTGLDGLRGMAEWQVQDSGLTLIRPMLCAERAQIAAYAAAENLEWREDSSNETDAYARNFLRHHVVPPLETLNPNFLHTAARNMERIGEAAANLNFLLHRQFAQNELDKQMLAQLPAPAQALRQLLKSRGFDAEQCRQVAQHLGQVGFELSSETGHQLLVDREKIVLREPQANAPAPAILLQRDDLMLRLPDGTSLFAMHGQVFSEAEAASNVAFLDTSRLRYPLTLRHWAPGDWFRPLGMGGQRQKLQDFFTNQKISRFDKDKTWLLLNADGAVVWVLGLRLDERFKVKPGTLETVKMVWETFGNFAA